MGRLKGGYSEEFPVGSSVRIRDRASLEGFMREWKLHDPLTADQLQFAGRVATVKSMGFYHGADELYWLEGVPGTWHEQCLEAAD